MHVMRRLSGVLFLVLLLSAPWLPLRAAEPWPPAEDGVLVNDPDAVWGRLANGQRYVVLPNTSPQGHVSLRLLIEAGSMMEAEDQRGLAHFLEHLAFNGSANLPPGELVRFLQREGLAFGPDTNAFTGLDRTVYRLDLPRNDPRLLDEALGILAEIQGRLLLAPEEIEAERGVILAEKRESDGPQRRFADAFLAFLLPGTGYATRPPIGDETVIRTAQRPRFVDFYENFYVPERAVLAVVGDVDPAAVVPVIEARFGGFAQPADAAPDPAQLPPPPAPTDALVMLDPALPALLSINHVLPADDRPDSLALQRDRIAEYIAATTLGRRLRTLSLQPGAALASAAAGASDLRPVARLGTLQLRIQGNAWREALTVAEQELRRALTYGFAESELAATRDAFRAELEAAAAAEPTRPSADVADGLVDVLADGGIASSAATDLALFDELAASIDAAEVQAALARLFGDGRPRLVLSGPPELAADREAVLAAHADSLARPVTAPVAADAGSFLYTQFGTPSGVVARETVDDLGILRVRFGNGVLLDLKPTDFEADTIHLAVRFGFGRMGLPPEQPGMDLLAQSAFVAGGLGRQGIAELSDILESRKVGADLVMGESGILLVGETTPRDLQLQLDLMAALFSDPGFRPEGMDRFRTMLSGLYPQLAGQPEGALSTSVARALRGGDPRYGVPPQAEVEKRTLPELRAWLEPLLRAGPVQISAVGAFDPDVLIDAVGRTFGALPPFPDAAAPPPPQLRPLPQDGVATLFHEGDADQALVAVYWPTTDGTDQRVATGLDLLADILGDRLMEGLREREGATYSPSAYSDNSLVLPGYGVLGAVVGVTPDDAQRALAEVVATAAALRDGGITEDELKRALQPRLAQSKAALRNNQYWLGRVLTGLNRLPGRLDMARNLVADVEAQTLESVQALADRYLDPAAALRFVVLPGPAGG